MKLRNACQKDLPEIMNLIDEGKKWMKSQGSSQWQNNYPTPEIISDDIKRGNSYILESDGKIIGTTAMIYGENSIYNQIYEGKWLTQGKNYMALGRMSIRPNLKSKGYGSVFFQLLEDLSRERGATSLRGYTYQENKAMVNYALKAGSTLCGKIKLEWGTMAVAFEKILEIKPSL